MKVEYGTAETYVTQFDVDLGENPANLNKIVVSKVRYVDSWYDGIIETKYFSCRKDADEYIKQVKRLNESWLEKLKAYVKNRQR